MAKTINKLILKGWLGKDAVTRYLPSGDPVTYFPLATHEADHTEWHPIYAYKDQSEIAQEFKQGDLVYFEGRIKTRAFKSEGYAKPRQVRELVASELLLIKKAGGKGEIADSLPPPINESDSPEDEQSAGLSDEPPKWI